MTAKSGLAAQRNRPASGKILARRRRRVLAFILIVLAASAWWWVGNGAASPVQGLDPELQRGVELAMEQAWREDVPMVINSGWRSAEHQQSLFDEAIVTYGSRAEAQRWVLPPEKSAHVQGKAVDIGPPVAAAWLESRGAEFGLCRVYENEPWHFEPLIEIGGECPPMLESAAAELDLS